MVGRFHIFLYIRYVNIMILNYERGINMICPKCGTENEEWSGYCYQCKKRLKPIKFGKATLFGIILCILESGAIFSLQLNSGLRKINSFSMISKIEFICVLGCMLLSLIGMIVLLAAKKKRGIIISELSWLAFLGFNIFMGGSPIASTALLLPVLGIRVSLISVWKDMTV